MKIINSIAVVIAVFIPFLMIANAMAVISHPLQALTTLSTGSGMEWIMLILIGAMTGLGTFYWLFYFEYEQRITARFNKLDTDHDGFVSRKDVSNSKRLATLFDRADVHHTGKVSRQEFQKAIAPVWLSS